MLEKYIKGVLTYLDPHKNNASTHKFCLNKDFLYNFSIKSKFFNQFKKQSLLY